LLSEFKINLTTPDSEKCTSQKISHTKKLRLHQFARRSWYFSVDKIPKQNRSVMHLQ